MIQVIEYKAEQLTMDTALTKFNIFSSKRSGIFLASKLT